MYQKFSKIHFVPWARGMYRLDTFILRGNQNSSTPDLAAELSMFLNISLEPVFLLSAAVYVESQALCFHNFSIYTAYSGTSHLSITIYMKPLSAG